MNPEINPEQIAQVCHEANRAYCLTIGDLSQPTWGEAPDWQRDSARSGVECHLRELKAGRDALPSVSHDNWLKEKSEQGWKYGPKKDPDKKEHPCFLPFEQLPPEQQMKDYLFVGIVRAFWRMSAVQAKAQTA